MSHDHLSDHCRLLSLRESAALFGVSEPTFRSFLKLNPEGFPQSFRPAKKIYFRRAELEKWLLGSAGDALGSGLTDSVVDGANLMIKRGRGRPRKL